MKDNEFGQEKGRSEWVTTKVSAPRDALTLYCFTASERPNGIIQGSWRRLEHEKNLFKRPYVLLDLWNSFPLCNDVPGCRVKKARLHFVSHLWPLICSAAVSCCFSTWHIATSAKFRHSSGSSVLAARTNKRSHLMDGKTLSTNFIIWTQSDGSVMTAAVVPAGYLSVFSLLAFADWCLKQCKRNRRTQKALHDPSKNWKN